MVETAGIRADRCQAYSAQPDPQAIANDIVARSRTSSGPDLAAIRRDLGAIEAQDTALALQARSAVEAQLTPVQQGQLAAAGYALTAPDGAPIALSDQGLTVAEQRASPAGSAAAEQYARFDRIWGDADPATNDTAAIEQGLRNMVASGLTVAQMEALGTLPAPANDQGPDTATLVADLAQMTLDLTGIVEPTPFSDGANTLISIGRSIGSAVSGDWGGAGGHLGNGALSAIGIVPYLGDLAKAGKIGKWAQTVADTIGAVAHNPALRQTLEPALREISNAVNKLPADVLNALPAGARESIEGMKRQLDEFFGAGIRATDEVAIAGGRMSGSTFVLDANKGTSFTAGGRTQAIGDGPVISPRTDGRQMVTDVNGDQYLVRQPATYDSRTINPDGTVTYTKDGQSVIYDQNGFPVFEAKADLHLGTGAINAGRDTVHFREANRMLGDALRADPSLAGRMGLDADQVRFLTRDTPAGGSPPDLTWHHHQDTGRMQLVDEAEHAHFSGGHTGGMRIWGGGRD